MLTAKEARILATDYAFSERWFCDSVLKQVEDYAKYGNVEVTLMDYCYCSNGFDPVHLERLRGLGYNVEYNTETGSLKVSW